MQSHKEGKKVLKNHVVKDFLTGVWLVKHRLGNTQHVVYV